METTRTLTREEARSWVAGFEEAAAAEREVWRREGPLPAHAIRAGLALIELGRELRGAPRHPDAVRAAGVAAAMESWRRLRAGWRR